MTTKVRAGEAEAALRAFADGQAPVWRRSRSRWPGDSTSDDADGINQPGDEEAGMDVSGGAGGGGVGVELEAVAEENLSCEHVEEQERGDHDAADSLQKVIPILA